METETITCVEITPQNVIRLAADQILHVAELAPAPSSMTAGTSGLPYIHWLADDSGDARLDCVDKDMLGSPEVQEAIRVMEDAYERADRGEHVDWNEMIERYGVG